MPARVFVSYRRSDSEEIVGRLVDRLNDRLGEDYVFRDVGSIEPGQDFTEALASNLSQCNAALVLIGDGWLTAQDEHGQRRLDDPADWVRREVAAVLERKIRVIPVLLDDTRMPSEAELPEPLRPLARKQAVKLRQDPDFDTDVERLLRHIPGGHPPVFLWNLALVLLLFALGAYWTQRYVDVSGSVLAGTLVGCLALAGVLFKVLPERRVRSMRSWVEERLFMNPRATLALGMLLPLAVLTASFLGGVRVVLAADAAPRRVDISDVDEQVELTPLEPGGRRKVFWALPWSPRPIDVAVEGLPPRRIEVTPWKLRTLTVPGDFLAPAVLVYCDSKFLAGSVATPPPAAMRCAVKVAGMPLGEVAFDGKSFYVGCGQEVGISKEADDALDAILASRADNESVKAELKSRWTEIGQGFEEVRLKSGDTLEIEVRHYPDAQRDEFTPVGRGETFVEDPAQSGRFPQLLALTQI